MGSLQGLPPLPEGHPDRDPPVRAEAQSPGDLQGRTKSPGLCRAHAGAEDGAGGGAPAQDRALARACGSLADTSPGRPLTSPFLPLRRQLPPLHKRTAGTRSPHLASPASPGLELHQPPPLDGSRPGRQDGSAQPAAPPSLSRPHPRPPEVPTGVSGSHTTSTKARCSFIPSSPNEPQRLVRLPERTQGAEPPDGHRPPPPRELTGQPGPQRVGAPQPGEAQGPPRGPPSLPCKVPLPHVRQHGAGFAVHPAAVLASSEAPLPDPLTPRR